MITTSADPAIPIKNSHSSTGDSTFMIRSIQEDFRLESQQPQNRSFGGQGQGDANPDGLASAGTMNEEKRKIFYCVRQYK